MKEVSRFILILVGVTSLALLMHLLTRWYLQMDIYGDRILLSYAGNLILASAILFGLMKAPRKLQNSLGFLFMLGSVFKFIFFFVFLYPFYLEDEAISKSEFLAFFVPYSACLITETKLLINRLSRD